LALGKRLSFGLHLCIQHTASVLTRNLITQKTKN